MSPKTSRPADEPEETGLPPGYVPLSPPPGQKPPRKPISVWWKAAAFVVLLAAAVVTIVVVSRPDPRDSARGTAELVAKSVTDADLAGFRSYLCNPNEPEVPDFVISLGTTTVLAVSAESNGVATATLVPGGHPEADIAVLLNNQDGTWCMAAVSACRTTDDTPVTSNPASTDRAGCRFRPGRKGSNDGS
jgi:hypothetical protein